MNKSNSFCFVFFICDVLFTACDDDVSPGRVYFSSIALKNKNTNRNRTSNKAKEGNKDYERKNETFGKRKKDTTER